MRELNLLEDMADAAIADSSYSIRVKVDSVLAIADAFRALEQENERAKELHSEYWHSMKQAQMERDVAQAKLAELERQEPIGMVVGKLGAGLRVSCYFMPDAVSLGDELFTRPAPAVSPVELVPDGWKLVPVEPTERMVINGFESEPNEFWSTSEEWEKYQAMSGCEQAAHRAKICYAAMLAAAPSPSDHL